MSSTSNVSSNTMQPVQTRIRGETLLQVIRYAICSFIALLVLVPLFVAAIGGFKTNADLVTSPFTLPNPFILENYTSVLSNQAFWTQLSNSTIQTAGYFSASFAPLLLPL